MAPITYESIKNNKDINTYITAGNDALGVLGYTEHGFAHATKTAETAAALLLQLGSPPREVELAKIAGYMHDIGNMINRQDHAQSGASLAFQILDKLGMEASELATVVSAIGNHDENAGIAVNRVTAALILADKSDVRRSRVRNPNLDMYQKDIHDRVNYAVRKSSLTLDDEKTCITLKLDIDTSVCPVMDYFEIFLTRMVMCRRAADFLGLKFALVINENRLL